ncbi:hypothetical protein [Rhodococcus sp. 21391]|uniref:hypothetical protein n=1 Tax=Rhodococcus sp. 21391 TaxID=2683591 RepID=UPI0003041E6E|nr:hypothetical protein [Rhodococcus sp. 21391]QQZ18143.1 hypothetical protein GO592_10845 [Rhodococcus sp. 21391]
MLPTVTDSTDAARHPRPKDHDHRRGAYLRKDWKGGSTKQNPRHTAAPDLLDREIAQYLGR